MPLLYLVDFTLFSKDKGFHLAQGSLGLVFYQAFMRDLLPSSSRCATDITTGSDERHLWLIQRLYLAIDSNRDSW